MRTLTLCVVLLSILIEINSVPTGRKSTNIENGKFFEVIFSKICLNSLTLKRIDAS